MNQIYLDWAATTPPLDTILQLQMTISKTYFGNPSSVHQAGIEAKNLLDSKRKQCADLLGTTPPHIIFTSGGTESNRIILESLIHKKQPGEILVSDIEHSSIAKMASSLRNLGFQITSIPVDHTGKITKKRLTELISGKTQAIFIMAVNNEIGVIQPIKSLAEMIRMKEIETGHSIHFHADAVQALGKIPISIEDWDVDSASFSSHKIQGPRGCGALYVKKTATIHASGGSQENGLRPGTENLAGIAAFVHAMDLSLTHLDSTHKHAVELNQHLINGLSKISEALIIPKERADNPDSFVPSITAFAAPPLPGEVIIRLLSEKGVYISTGSACSSRERKKIGIAQKLGYSKDIANSFLRVSTGPSTTIEEVDLFLTTLKEIINNHRFLYKKRR